jgi:hypothetical protein
MQCKQIDDHRASLQRGVNMQGTRILSTSVKLSQNDRQIESKSTG